MSVSWSHDGAGAITDANTLIPTYTPVLADAGNVVTLTLTVNGSGTCVAATSEKRLQVNPVPVFTITNNPADPSTISNGESTDIDISITTPGGQVTLTDVTASSMSVTGYAAVGTIYPDGFKLEDKLANSSNNTHSVIYEFTASTGSCINPTVQTVQVFVNPAPNMVVVNNNPTICSGETTDIDLSSLTTNAVIEIASISIAPDAGSITGFSAVGTQWDDALGQLPATIVDNLSNSTDDIQTITYELTVSAPGFTNTATQFIDVIVNPTPSLTVTNSSTTINSGSATDILLNTPTENGLITLLSVTKSDPALVGNTLPAFHCQVVPGWRTSC